MFDSHAPNMLYRYIEMSDIHEIRLNSPVRETIITLFERLNTIYDAVPPSGTTRILIIQTGMAAPLAYFMTETRAFVSLRRKTPQPTPARFAIVMEKTPFIQLINQMLKLMRYQDWVVFFNPDEEQAAIAWLLL